MFRRDMPISRSFHTPHGVNIVNCTPPDLEKLKRKSSFSRSGKIRNALSDTMLAHRSAILKEGYLYKPTLFRLGGRKQRWCVLRAHNQSEPASIDVYTDDTKTHLKRSIPLDKKANPIVIKNGDVSGIKKKSTKHTYFALKVGKKVNHFTTKSWRELEEWCALIRQATDSGHTFSGRVTEPADLGKTCGTINVVFQSGCMTLRCPIREDCLKSWRLEQITSFGQCGEILTFECCPQCSEPGAICRASIHLLQDSSVSFLNVMEKAIRSSQACTEIHYERSMLGDIYHCRHDCGRGRGSVSPVKMVSAPYVVPAVAAVDVHGDMRAIESSDSGLPGTPQTEEALSITSGISSPTSNNKYNQVCSKLYLGSSKLSSNYARDRSVSDTQVCLADSADRLQNRRSDDSYVDFEDKSMRSVYAKVSPNPELPLQPARNDPSGKGFVNYTSIQVVPTERRPFSCNPAKSSNEDPLYDEPTSSGDASLAATRVPAVIPRTRLGSCDARDPHPAKGSYTQHYHQLPPPKISTVDTREADDSEGDYFDIVAAAPPVPVHRKPLRGQGKEGQSAAAKADPLTSSSSQAFRGRLHSSSDVLERGGDDVAARATSCDRVLKGRVNSTDQLLQDRELKGNSDLLARLHEEERKLTSILESTRRTSKAVLSVPVGNGLNSSAVPAQRPGDYRSPFFALKEQDYDEPDGDSDGLDETCSNLAEYTTNCNVYSSPQATDKKLSKVPTTTARGYAYKITIPVTNNNADIQYDVPRRAAAVPDLGRVPGDAPPKPRRYISSEQLCAK